MSDWSRMSPLDCTLILDEFYSHYVWSDHPQANLSRSSASYVEDVDRDPVLIVDGLIRIGDTQAEDRMDARTESRHRRGQFGGQLPGRWRQQTPQRAAIPLLKAGVPQEEMKAIRTCFRKKRDVMISGLRRLGVPLTMIREAPSTYGVTLRYQNAERRHVLLPSSSGLPGITVPGIFDVNPGEEERNARADSGNMLDSASGPNCLTWRLD